MLDSQTLYGGSAKKVPPGGAGEGGIWRGRSSSQRIWRRAGQFRHSGQAGWRTYWAVGQGFVAAAKLALKYTLEGLKSWMRSTVKVKRLNAGISVVSSLSM